MRLAFDQAVDLLRPARHWLRLVLVAMVLAGCAGATTPAAPTPLAGPAALPATTVPATPTQELPTQPTAQPRGSIDPQAYLGPCRHWRAAT
ncbi:MAG: hypothetical protein U0Z44_06515 [Kouleothrix sp.]